MEAHMKAGCYLVAILALPALSAHSAHAAQNHPKGSAAASRQIIPTPQAGYDDKAPHHGIADSIGGLSISGTGMARPGSGTSAVGIGTKANTGGVNGTSIRTRHP